MRISTKVALSISVVVAVAGAMATTVALSVQEQERRAEFAAKSIETLQLLAASVGASVAEQRHERVQALIDNVANQKDKFPQVTDLVVIDLHGRVLAALDPTRFNDVVEDSDLASDLALHDPRARQEKGALSVVVPLRTTHHHGVIRARFEQERLALSIAQQKRDAGVLVVATMLLVAVALDWILRRLVASRITKLAQTAGALSAGRLTVRANASGKDEIAALGHSFNRMAGALQHYTDDLEQIISERTDDLQKANRRLEQLAITDQLTGLANRRHFDENARRALEVARRNERPLSVVLADADSFKTINDRHGHAVGDAVLQCIARVMADNARKADLVARVGGEEFAVLMPEAGVGLARQGAERMREALERTVHLQVPQLGDSAMTASFGVAAYERADDRLEDLLSAADTALYRSKTAGRNRVTIVERGAAPTAPSDTKEIERDGG